MMKRKLFGRLMSVVLSAALVMQMPATDMTNVFAATVESEKKASVSGIADTNLDFEAGLEGWEVTGTVDETEDAQAGEKGIVLSANASITTTIEDIAQGSYTLSAWVKGTAGSGASINVTQTGAPDAVLLLDTYKNADTWTQAGHRNVLVYNGQMTITITAGNQALYIDSLGVALDSEDENTISNWDFEEDLTGWNTAGTVAADADNADTGAKAVSLAAGSEISQIVAVEPNTKYSVTMRAKVDKQDTFTSTDVYYDGSTTEVEGKLVDRTSLGDRVNLGVRSLNGTVLRQAPSGTEDYSLITLTFETGAEDTQVEIYANTIYDDNYKESVTIYKTEGTELADDWQGNGTDLAYVDNFDLFSIQDENYIKGADVSFLPVIEDNDGKYFANGVQQDCLRILANHGVNSITAMIFVKAGNPVHNPTSLDVIPHDWYYTADGSLNITKMVEGGYFDKNHSLELGKRATELGMSYLPSFHYSDYWMSNAKAYTPEEWINVDYEGNLSNTDLAHMQSIVYNYVYDFMKNLADNDVNVGGVKLGNEQNGGIVWPVGQGATSTGHAALIAASYEAVADTFPGISSYVHSNNGYTTGGFDSFFQTLLNNGAEFDGTAFSLYGGRSSGNIILMANAMQDRDSMKYMDYINVETAFTFTKYKAVSAQQNSAMGQSQYYVTSSNGQYNWLLDYMQAGLDAVNPYGQTRGFYYWETDWIPTPGAASSYGGTADVCARTMFNNGDTSIHEMGSTQDGKTGDMLDSMYAYLMRGCAKNKAETMQTPLRDAGDYEVEVTEPTGITLSKETITLAEGAKERLQPTITPIDKVLSDSDVDYTSSNTEVASVTEDGFVCARQAGTATITASVKGDYTAEVAVTVTSAAKAEGITLTVDDDAVANNDTKEAEVNKKLQMSAALTGSPENQTVVYTSSNPEVASFFGETWQTPAGEMRQETNKSTKVQLNVKKTGTTTITAASADGSVSTSYMLTATKTAAESVSIDQTEVSISYNRTVQLNATVAPADTTLYLVHWESSDETIATVDENGLVKGVGIGEVTIKAVSDDSAEVYGECTVHVLQVQPEAVELNKTKMTIQIGSTKAVSALVTPDDTYDKSVNWTSANEAVATVNAAGEITGIASGTTTITATTVTGGLTASCEVTVQEDAVPVEGVNLKDTEYYFVSDYFSETNQSEEAPVYRAAAETIPDSATNSDVTWTSDTPSVATVDAYGRVTAVSAGVAKITATTADGGYQASMNVYVPAVSEDCENVSGENPFGMSVGAITSNSAAKFDSSITTEDENNVLTLTAGGNGGRSTQKVLKQKIVNDKIILDFDWNIGTTSYSAGNYIAITDSSNQRYLTLQMNANTELIYATGGLVGDSTNLTEGTAVGEGFNVDNTWYDVHVVLDMEAKQVTFTITSKADDSLTATHQEAFDSATEFVGDVNAIQLYASRKGGKMSWTTKLDNMNIYAAAPVAKEIKLSQTAVKLIPIEGTLCVSKQLTASVAPETADANIVWSSSDETIATVSADGLVTAANTYQSLDDVVAGICTVRAESAVDSTVYTEVTVTISNSPNAAEFFSVKDETETVVYDTADGGRTITLDSGNEKTLTPVVTGGDGDADIAKLAWVSGDEDIVTIDGITGKLTAIAPGTTTVTLTLTLYAGAPLTAAIPVTVTGVARVKTTALAAAIKAAETAKDKEDYYYTAESLTAYQSALAQAKTDYEAAVSEKWTSEKQSIIDADTEVLNQAAAGLRLKEVIGITELEITGGDTPISIGKCIALVAAVVPEVANERVIWTSSDTSVAVVGTQTGVVKAVAEGTAVITATSESGEVSAEKTITVTSDLSSYYEANGVTVTGTNENRPATHAFVNAQTMNLAGGNSGKNAWTTGSSTTVGEIVADFGTTVRVDNVKTAFWSLMKYTIDISEDGSEWTTVCDHSEEAAGALSDGTEAYTDAVPEGTTARYVRLNVLENSGTGWVGVTIMQVNGAYLNDVRVVDTYTCAEVTASVDETLAEKMSETVTAAFIGGTTEEVNVEWNAEAVASAEGSIGTHWVAGTITADGITYQVICKVTVKDAAEILDLTNAALTLAPAVYTYDGTAKEPAVTVVLGEKTLTSADYTVSYSNNTNAGTATVTVTGKGSYTGTASKTYTITQANLAGAALVLAQTSYTYDGKVKEPSVTATLNGKALGTADYTVSYANNTDAGTATVTVSGKGNYAGTATAQYTIKKAAKTISAAKSAITKIYGNAAFALGASTVKGEKLTYTSSSKSVVTVSSTGRVKIAGCGKATITVKSAASKNYDAATKKITITVKPKKAKLASVKNSSAKKITVKWSKDTKVSGYEISYSTKRNFKGAKTYTVKSNKTTSKTFSKLSKGKTYYVRIRSYKTVSGKKLYGAYSTVKTVKIKK